MNCVCIERLEERQFLSANPVQTRAITGHRDVLFVEIKFAGQSSFPDSTTSAQSIVNGAVHMIESWSGGNLNFSTAVKTVTLSHSAAYYTSAGTGKIASDADAALARAGVSESPYEHISYRYNGVSASWAGLGQVGGKRTWIRSSASTVVAHEFGHNLGLGHSHLADPKGTDPFGSYTSVEYGDPFSNMGSGGSQDWAAYQKYKLGWLGGDRTKTIDASKAVTRTLDISTNDDVSVYNSTSVYLVRILIGNGNALYLSYDAGKSGILIHKSSATDSGGGYLIDTTPGTSSASDAPLQFGKSIIDHRGAGTADDIKISCIKVGSKAEVTVKIG
jgi:hypothetical protein